MSAATFALSLLIAAGSASGDQPAPNLGPATSYAPGIAQASQSFLRDGSQPEWFSVNGLGLPTSCIVKAKGYGMRCRWEKDRKGFHVSMVYAASAKASTITVGVGKR